MDTLRSWDTESLPKSFGETMRLLAELKGAGRRRRHFSGPFKRRLPRFRTLANGRRQQLHATKGWKYV